jgi:DNA invertase Pin-like site-specific DNA recombinase
LGETRAGDAAATVAPVRERSLYPDQARTLDRIIAKRDRGHAGVDERFATELRDLIESGAEVAAVARHLGKSRETVYAWLRQKGAG